jgi:hypothetical protein
MYAPLYTQLETEANLTPAAIQSIGQCASPLSAAFFSKENLNNLQITLRDRVRCNTGYTIARQSDDTLLVIMRAIYALHAQNPTTPTDVTKEVQRINELVLQDIVPMAAGNLASYLGYLRDASALPTPIARGVNTSRKGADVFSLFPSLE